MSVKTEHILLVGVVAVGGYFLWKKREEADYMRDGLVGPMPFPAPAPAPLPAVTPAPAEAPWWGGVIDALPGVSRLVQQWLGDLGADQPAGRGVITPRERQALARQRHPRRDDIVLHEARQRWAAEQRARQRRARQLLRDTRVTPGVPHILPI